MCTHENLRLTIMGSVPMSLIISLICYKISSSFKKIWSVYKSFKISFLQTFSFLPVFEIFYEISN